MLRLAKYRAQAPVLRDPRLTKAELVSAGRSDFSAKGSVRELSTHAHSENWYDRGHSDGIPILRSLTSQEKLVHVRLR